MRYKLCSKSQLENLEVIHYGSRVYYPERINPIKNGLLLCKPHGGLWTSPVYSDHSWRWWCKLEKYKSVPESLSFKLKFNNTAKVIIIDSIKDLMDLPVRKDIDFAKSIDFEKLSKKYDGIWLTEVGQIVTENYDDIIFSGWDVETVFIMNSECCSEI